MKTVFEEKKTAFVNKKLYFATVFVITHIFKLCQLYNLISLLNAEVERGFSRVNLIKRNSHLQ